MSLCGLFLPGAAVTALGVALVVAARIVPDRAGPGRRRYRNGYRNDG